MEKPYKVLQYNPRTSQKIIYKVLQYITEFKRKQHNFNFPKVRVKVSDSIELSKMDVWYTWKTKKPKPQLVYKHHAIVSQQCDLNLYKYVNTTISKRI